MKQLNTTQTPYQPTNSKLKAMKCLRTNSDDNIDQNSDSDEETSVLEAERPLTPQLISEHQDLAMDVDVHEKLLKVDEKLTQLSTQIEFLVNTLKGNKKSKSDQTLIRFATSILDNADTRTRVNTEWKFDDLKAFPSRRNSDATSICRRDSTDLNPMEMVDVKYENDKTSPLEGSSRSHFNLGLYRIANLKNNFYISLRQRGAWKHANEREHNKGRHLIAQWSNLSKKIPFGTIFKRQHRLKIHWNALSNIAQVKNLTRKDPSAQDFIISVIGQILINNGLNNNCILIQSDKVKSESSEDLLSIAETHPHSAETTPPNSTM